MLEAAQRRGGGGAGSKSCGAPRAGHRAPIADHTARLSPGPRAGRGLAIELQPPSARGARPSSARPPRGRPRSAASCATPPSSPPRAGAASRASGAPASRLNPTPEPPRPALTGRAPPPRGGSPLRLPLKGSVPSRRRQPPGGGGSPRAAWASAGMGFVRALMGADASRRRRSRPGTARRRRPGRAGPPARRRPSPRPGTGGGRRARRPSARPRPTASPSARTPASSAPLATATDRTPSTQDRPRSAPWVTTGDSPGVGGRGGPSRG